MKLIESAKKLTALAVAFTFALSPVPVSFANDSTQQISEINGQSVPVVNPEALTPRRDLENHMAQPVQPTPEPQIVSPISAIPEPERIPTRGPIEEKNLDTANLTLNDNGDNFNLNTESKTGTSTSASTGSQKQFSDVGTFTSESTTCPPSGSCSTLSASMMFDPNDTRIQIGSYTKQENLSDGSTQVSNVIILGNPIPTQVYVSSEVAGEERNQAEIILEINKELHPTFYKTTSIHFECETSPCGMNATDNYYGAGGSFLGSRNYDNTISVDSGLANSQWYNTQGILIDLDRSSEMVAASEYLDEAQKAFKQLPVFQLKIEQRPICSGEGDQMVCTANMPQDTIEYYDADRNLLGRVVVKSWEDNKEWYGPNWETLSIDDKRIVPVEPMNLGDNNITLHNNAGTLDFNRSAGTAIITSNNGQAIEHTNIILFNVGATICTEINGCETIMASLPEDMRNAKQIATFTRQQNMTDGTMVSQWIVYVNEPTIRGEDVPADLAEEATRILGQTPDSMSVTPDVVCVMDPCRQGPKTFTFLDKDGNKIGSMVKTIGYDGDIESGKDTIQWYDAEGNEIKLDVPQNVLSQAQLDKLINELNAQMPQNTYLRKVDATIGGKPTLILQIMRGQSTDTFSGSNMAGAIYIFKDKNGNFETNASLYGPTSRIDNAAMIPYLVNSNVSFDGEYSADQQKLIQLLKTAPTLATISRDDARLGYVEIIEGTEEAQTASEKLQADILFADEAFISCELGAINCKEESFKLYYSRDGKLAGKHYSDGRWVKELPSANPLQKILEANAKVIAAYNLPREAYEEAFRNYIAAGVTNLTITKIHAYSTPGNYQMSVTIGDKNEAVEIMRNQDGSYLIANYWGYLGGEESVYVNYNRTTGEAVLTGGVGIESKIEYYQIDKSAPWGIGKSLRRYEGLLVVINRESHYMTGYEPLDVKFWEAEQYVNDLIARVLSGDKSAHYRLDTNADGAVNLDDIKLLRNTINTVIVDERLTKALDTVLSSLPPAIAAYVQTLKNQFPKDGTKVSATPQSDGTYLVTIDNSFQCPEGMMCTMVAPAPGSFGSMTFNLKADATRVPKSINANYNGVTVTGADADLLFAAMTACPQGESCPINVMAESDASILAKMTSISVSKIEKNAIYFTKGGKDFRVYSNVEKEIILEEIQKIIKIDVSPEENLNLNAIFGQQAAYKTELRYEVKCMAIGCIGSKLISYFSQDGKIMGTQKTPGMIGEPSVWQNADKSQVQFQTEIAFAGIANQIFGQVPAYQLSRSSGPVCGAGENCPTVMPVRTTYFFDSNFKVIGTFNEDFKTWQNADGKLIAEQKIVSGAELSEMLDILRGTNRRRTLVQNFWKIESPANQNPAVTSFYDELGNLLLTKSINKPDAQTTVTTWRGAAGNTKQMVTVTVEGGNTTTVTQDDLGRTVKEETVYSWGDRYTYAHSYVGNTQTKSETLWTIHDSEGTLTNESRAFFKKDAYGADITITAGRDIFMGLTPPSTVWVETTEYYFWFESSVANGNAGRTITAFTAREMSAEDFSKVTAELTMETAIQLAAYKSVSNYPENSNQFDSRLTYSNDGSADWAQKPLVQDSFTGGKYTAYAIVGAPDSPMGSGDDILIKYNQPKISVNGKNYYANWFTPWGIQGSTVGIYFQDATTGKSVFAAFPKESRVTLDGVLYEISLNKDSVIELKQMIEKSFEIVLPASTDGSQNNLKVSVALDGTATVTWYGTKYSGTFDPDTKQIKIEIPERKYKDDDYILHTMEKVETDADRAAVVKPDVEEMIIDRWYPYYEGKKTWTLQLSDNLNRVVSFERNEEGGYWNYSSSSTTYYNETGMIETESWSNYSYQSHDSGKTEYTYVEINSKHLVASIISHSTSKNSHYKKIELPYETHIVEKSDEEKIMEERMIRKPTDDIAIWRPYNPASESTTKTFYAYDAEGNYSQIISVSSSTVNGETTYSGNYTNYVSGSYWQPDQGCYKAPCHPDTWVSGPSHIMQSASATIPAAVFEAINSAGAYNLIDEHARIKTESHFSGDANKWEGHKFTVTYARGENGLTPRFVQMADYQTGYIVVGQVDLLPGTEQLSDDILIRNNQRFGDYSISFGEAYEESLRDKQMYPTTDSSESVMKPSPYTPKYLGYGLIFSKWGEKADGSYGQTTVAVDFPNVKTVELDAELFNIEIDADGNVKLISVKKQLEEVRAELLAQIDNVIAAFNYQNLAEKLAGAVDQLDYERSSFLNQLGEASHNLRGQISYLEKLLMNAPYLSDATHAAVIDFLNNASDYSQDLDSVGLQSSLSEYFNWFNEKLGRAYQEFYIDMEYAERFNSIRLAILESGGIEELEGLKVSFQEMLNQRTQETGDPIVAPQVNPIDTVAQLVSEALRLAEQISIEENRWNDMLPKLTIKLESAVMDAATKAGVSYGKAPLIKILDARMNEDNSVEITYTIDNGNSFHARAVVDPSSKEPVSLELVENPFEKNPVMTDAVDFVSEATRILGQIPVYQLKTEVRPSCSSDGVCTMVESQDTIEYFDGDKNSIGSVIVIISDGKQTWYTKDHVKLTPLPENAVALTETEHDFAASGLGLGSDVGTLFKTTAVTACIAAPCPEANTTETLYLENGVIVGFKIISGDQLVFQNASGQENRRLTIVKDPTELDWVNQILVNRKPEYASSFWAMFESIRNQANIPALKDSNDEDSGSNDLSLADSTLEFLQNS